MFDFIKLNSFFILILALGTGTACNSSPPAADDDDAVGDDDDAVGDDDDDVSGDDDDDSAGDDDDTTDDPDHQEPPTAEEFGALVQEAREDLLQTFTVDPDAIGVIEGDLGSTVSFPWTHGFTHLDGTPVTGDVTVELVEIFDRGSMLVADIPSMGLTEAGESALLISGGEHFVNVTQEGEQLQMDSPFILTAPVGDDEDDAEAMGLFTAEAAFDDEVLWVEEEPNPDMFGVVREDDPNGGGEMAVTGYWSLSNEFGWTNIDRWYSDPRPKTTIHVDVPEGWDDSNCAVYLSYDGEGSALAGFDMYDADAELFTEHYGLIPIGLEVHVILVTENEGLWSYAIQGQTVVVDHLTEFDSAGDLTDTDLDGLIAVINALP